MMKPGTPSFLVGDDLRPFISKFGVPALLVLGGLMVLGSATKLGGAVLGGILVGFGVLQFYVCGLAQASPECVWYRRFRRWERIEYNEIVKCGTSIFPPGLGYLKLSRFVPPCGKLYFAFYDPGASPWEQLDLGRKFLDYIRVRMGKPAGSVTEKLTPSSAHFANDTLRTRLKRCSVFASLGGGIILFSRVFVGWPGSNFPPPIEPGQPWFYRANVYWWQFCHQVLDWPLNLIAVVVLLTGIFALRFNRAATSLAVALGALVGGLLARLFGA